MGVHFCRSEWIKMGRQSDQVERVACGSGKSINFYQSEGCRECCGFEIINGHYRDSIHEMQKYFVKNFPEYLDRE